MVLFRREASSAVAAFASRVPRDWMSHRIDLVKVTADSNVVFPLADLRTVSPRGPRGIVELVT